MPRLRCTRRTAGASALIRPAPDPQWANLLPAAEIGGISIHSQSVGLGAYTSAISTAPYAYALSFAGGARPQDAGEDSEAQFGPLKPLVEKDKVVGIIHY